jgi:membrane fusion protein, heavy metal efflux system
MSENNQTPHEENGPELTTTTGGSGSGPPLVELQQAAKRKRPPAAIIALVMLCAVAASAVLVWLLWPSRAGKPVSAPRSIAVTEPAPNAAPPGELKLTLTAGQLNRADLRIESVGERAAPELNAHLATGVVQSNAYRETPVVSLVGGVVRSVRAELGQSVARGQSLVVVSSNEVAEAESRYLTALAELEEHHKHHSRTAKLVEIGAASHEEFESATTKLKTAEADVANLRQKLLLLGLPATRVDGLNRSGQVNLEIAIPSPASGTVTTRMVNPGEVIEANKELLRITDLSSVWVVGQIYEQDLGRVIVGSGANVTADAYPGRVFRGRVSYVDPHVEPATRTAQVRIELGNPGQALKIGMYVNIAFATIGGAENTIAVIPTAAVQNINNQQTVFLATSEPNVFLLRDVRLGPESNGFYPVLAGLATGDRIVTEGSFLLRAEWLKMNPVTAR